MIYRLVGFVEYGKALEHFDALLQAVTPEELQAVEQIITASDEFAVYTVTQKAAAPGAGTNNLTAASHRGLAWMMALARVEMGAMIGAFAQDTNPFENVRPSRFEMTAYRELLLEGARSHYVALSSDPELQQVARRSPPDARTLTYLRRTNLARHFVISAARAGAQDFTPAQQAELLTVKTELDNLFGGFVRTIQEYLASGTTNTTSSSSIGSTVLKACVDGVCRQHPDFKPNR